MAGSRVPSLRSTLLLNQVPMWVFGVAILGVTGIVLGTVEAWEGRLVGEIDAGTLGSERVVEIASFIRVAWLASLAGFFAFAGAGTAVSLANHRALSRRIGRVTEYAQARCDGLNLEDLQALSDDAIGELEKAVSATALLADTRSAALHAELARQRFASQLQTALELADSEAQVYDLARHALETSVDAGRVELLLADNSQAHLRSAVSIGLEGRGCPVASPDSCAAVRRGQTLRFEDSHALDACPRLREKGGDPSSAACTPVGVMGRTIGVLHAIGEWGSPPSEADIARLETLATGVGGRLGMVRTLRSSRLQARTDTLTGLLNRRAFEEDALGVVRQGGSHAFVMFDLDHFKRLNDRHGHATGDRALKLFAQTLRETLRQDDVVGRRGGEEFVACLADCDADGAMEMLQRLRVELGVAVQRAGVPAFTASAGVAMTPRDGDDIEDLLRAADKALYEAKVAGRDRVIFFGVANEDMPGYSLEGEAVA